MATYAIGDLQGCYHSLEKLLKHIAYQPQQDRLWFCGDLVNRGPDSLACLRFVKHLVETQQAITVLGNHDLHLLAVYFQNQCLNPDDTLTEILQAPDAHALCHWLRQQALIHFDSQLNCLLVHAGLPPQWSVNIALALTEEVNQQLRGDHYLNVLVNMYGNQPHQWQDNLKGSERSRFIINACTRLRFCDAAGKLDLSYKGTIDHAPASLIPWFAHPECKWRQDNDDLTIVFGHWAALYPHWQQIKSRNIIPLDSGCVWGHALTAVRLEDRQLFQVTATHS